jgi:hypothetical protein
MRGLFRRVAPCREGDDRSGASRTQPKATSSGRKTIPGACSGVSRSTNSNIDPTWSRRLGSWPSMGRPPTADRPTSQPAPPLTLGQTTVRRQRSAHTCGGRGRPHFRVGSVGRGDPGATRDVSGEHLDWWPVAVARRPVHSLGPRRSACSDAWRTSGSWARRSRCSFRPTSASTTS